ncbi:MAG TPA: hypothetical protein DEF78_05145, partial [Sphingobacterium sp.]|nr:hypothetical protein [Sphingobacterium sp.]
MQTFPLKQSSYWKGAPAELKRIRFEMEEKLRLFDLARQQMGKYPNLDMFAHKVDGKWNYIKTAD